MEHRVAAGLDPVAQDRPELAPPGRQPPAVGERDLDRSAVVPEVGQHGAGAEVDLAAQQRVADVVEVGGARFR